MSFISEWNSLFQSSPNKDYFLGDDFLHRFAMANNVEVLATVLVQAIVKNPKFDQEKKEENTFLHTLVEKHDLKILKSLFQEINQKETEE